MLGRLFSGLLIGLIVGLAAGAGLVFGLHLTFASAIFAYVASAATGSLTGLVAGKPIWSSDGKIEAGLKAAFGAVVGAAAMFAIRKWLNVDLALEALHLGHGPIGELPMVALPLVGAVLGGFYEADNTPSASRDDDQGAATKKGVEKMRVVADAEAEADEEEEVEEAPAKGKKRR